MKVRLYVEGGPIGVDADGLRSFRTAFKQHFEKLDPGLKALEVVMRGSTDQTIKAYTEAVRQFAAEYTVALLVDSDSAVTANTPALHLRPWLDSAHVPADARRNLFLMVQCMEAWLVTDPEAFKKCFGNRVRLNVLPPNPDIEAVPKRDVFAAIEGAIRQTPAGRYLKVQHGSKLIAALNPDRVSSRSRHARDLYSFLRASI